MKMAELKREYVVPLRRKTRTAPKWRRSKKAMSVLRDFIKKHMKTDNVVICKELNEKVWGRGIKNPPGKVSVIALKTQISGVEKTLVNLTEFGVDKYLEMYEAQKVNLEESVKKATQSENSEDKKKDKVVDAQVEEVEEKKEQPKEKEQKKEKKETTKKSESKKEEKKENKSSEKKEVKKNE